MPTTSLLQVARRCGIQTPLSVRDDLVPYAADVPGNSLKAVLAYANARSSDNPDSAALVSISATATITAVNLSLAGYDHTIEVSLKLTNLTGEFLAVDSSALLLTDSGGYVLSVNSSLFGEKGILSAATVPILPQAVLTGSTNLTWGGGPFNVVVNLCVRTEGGERQNVVQRVKILRPGFAAPQNIAVPAPVYVGLWNRPVEVTEIWRSAGADRWLTFAGQIVNLSPRTVPVRVRRWRVWVLKAAKKLFDLNPPLSFRRVNPDGSIGSAIAPAPDGTVTLQDLRSAFVFGFSVIGMPSVVSDATLMVILDYDYAPQSGQELSGIATCAYNLINRNATLLPEAPVKSLPNRNWFWGNGPDHTGFDAHAWSGERYCYDLTMRDSNNDTFAGACNKPQQPGGPWTGACSQNTSFYDYGQPVSAAVAGTVVLANYSSPENFGYNANPQTGVGNYVVTQLPDGSVAGYFHIHPEPSPGPAAPGLVAVGAALGRVGNSGGSSEPHLHFGYVTMDHTGRGIITPVAFANLKTPGGDSVTIMPGTATFKS
jgi:hypothetical protein